MVNLINFRLPYFIRKKKTHFTPLKVEFGGWGATSLKKFPVPRHPLLYL